MVRTTLNNDGIGGWKENHHHNHHACDNNTIISNGAMNPCCPPPKMESFGFINESNNNGSSWNTNNMDSKTKYNNTANYSSHGVAKPFETGRSSSRNTQASLNTPLLGPESALDRASILFGDLHIGSSWGGAPQQSRNDIHGGGQSSALPLSTNSPAPCFGSEINRDRSPKSSYKYPIHPSHQQSSSPKRLHNFRLRPRPNQSKKQDRGRPVHPELMKDPPPSSMTPNQNHHHPNRMDMRKPPPASSSSPREEPQESHHHHHHHHHHSKHLGRGSLKPPPPSFVPPSTTQRTKSPTIPRSIHLSYESAPIGVEQSSKIATPQLSPISFSSSMLLKKIPSGHIYPSRDVVEAQTSFRINETDILLPTYEAAATTTEDPILLPTVPLLRFDGRPQKPVRIDTLLPSGQRREDYLQHRVSTPMPPQNQWQAMSQQHQPQEPPTGPCPLPDGNGITNGTATRIHRKEFPESSALPREQEYDLQALLPSHREKPQGDVTNKTRTTPYNDRTHTRGVVPSGFSSSFSSSIQVEIYPGVFHVLRGAMDIAQARKENSFVSCTCVVCSVGYCCIGDAAFAICPNCKVVCPLETVAATVANTSGSWGVSLGFSAATTE